MPLSRRSFLNLVGASAPAPLYSTLIDSPGRYAALDPPARPLRQVRVDKECRSAFDKMARADGGAWLVFFGRQNNSAGTVGAARAVGEVVDRVRREWPETAILIDEAYHDYVTDPGYAT